MNRRAAILSCAALLVALPLHAENTAAAYRGVRFKWPILQWAFEALSDPRRRKVQAELQAAGFYDGAVDGLYGKASQTALASAAEFLTYDVEGVSVPELLGEAGATEFLNMIADGVLARHRPAKE